MAGALQRFQGRPAADHGAHARLQQGKRQALKAAQAMTAPAQAIERPLELASLRQQAAHCRECPPGAVSTQTVWGDGDARARLMIVGEQPGDREDLVGKPFVGPAGHLLDKAFDTLGWDRPALYVTNAVKHFK